MSSLIGCTYSRLDIQPNYSVIEWDENVLDVVDPYFLFFLRSSPILGDVARKPGK